MIEDAAISAGRGRLRSHTLILVWMAVFCCAVALSAAAVPERAVSGVSMPEVVSVAGKDLRLNGMGLRKMHVFFDVYVVGLYLEKPTTDAGAAVTTDEAKRIVLVMLRDVSRSQFVEAVKEGILRNSGPEMPTLRTRLDRMEEALPALKKGNVLDFTYLPGAGTLMRGQGREMTIPGKDFGDALFSVWLGPKPISEALKRQLLSGLPSAPATHSIAHMRIPAPREAVLSPGGIR
jgi:hypothetical protein